MEGQLAKFLTVAAFSKSYHILCVELLALLCECIVAFSMSLYVFGYRPIYSTFICRYSWTCDTRFLYERLKM